jgi:Gluconate 2-dehydrogenase subunit 3
VTPAAPRRHGGPASRGHSGPVTPGNQGRFGDFDVLAEIGHWDPVTTGVVLARLDPDPQLAFFSTEEEPTLRALLDLLLAQHDEPRVPVAELIDHRLATGETDGWRYEDMPEDSEAWQHSLAALDEEARTAFGDRFSQLDPDRQGQLVQAVHDAQRWHSFDGAHLWSLWTRYACTAFYSHPWAWNEIGFGGPAYPRGYKNLGIGKQERWERSETDAADPVPWATRRESARRAHQARRDGPVDDRGAAPPESSSGGQE